MTKEDELDAFFVDENEPVSATLVAEIIKPYVNTIGKNKVIDFTSAFYNLSYWKKILVFLVCRKAMFIKGVVDEEKIGPKEIAEATHISESSAKKIAINDYLKKWCSGENGKYLISNYKLKKLKEDLLKDG